MLCGQGLSTVLVRHTVLVLFSILLIFRPSEHPLEILTQDSMSVEDIGITTIFTYNTLLYSTVFIIIELDLGFYSSLNFAVCTVLVISMFVLQRQSYKILSTTDFQW